MITSEDFYNAKQFNPTLIKRYVSGNNVLGVQCSIEGIKGGRGTDKNAKKVYNILFDLSNIKKTIPKAFVVENDSCIKHVNIFGPQESKLFNSRYPVLCWGDNKKIWENTISYKNKSLANLLSFTSHVLNNQDFGSAAR